MDPGYAAGAWIVEDLVCPLESGVSSAEPAACSGSDEGGSGGQRRQPDRDQHESAGYAQHLDAQDEARAATATAIQV